MSEELRNKLINAMIPIVDSEYSATDIGMIIDVALSGFEVKKISREIVPYQGNANEQAVKMFLSAKIAKGLSIKSINNYQGVIMNALGQMGKQFNQINANDIRLYLAGKIRNGLTKTSADNERRVLQSFYRWLQREEIITGNPMDKVDCIKIPKRKKKAFSAMELEQIRGACVSDRDAVIVETLLSTWCRVSELAGVKLNEIEGDAVTVHGKGNKDRIVYLNAKSQYAIEKYVAGRKNATPYLIAPSRITKSPKMTPGGIENAVRSIGERAGVANCHPHRFRRTGATMALRQGMPLLTVSKLLGHESVETTQIYLDISDKELEQAHEKYVI